MHFSFFIRRGSERGDITYLVTVETVRGEEPRCPSARYSLEGRDGATGTSPLLNQIGTLAQMEDTLRTVSLGHEEIKWEYFLRRIAEGV